MSDGLTEDSGGDALGRTLDELEGEWAADAVAHKEELVYAEMIHQAKLVVREGSPRVFDLHRAAGLSADGVALVHSDAAEVVFEHLHRVEDLVRPTAHNGVQAPARRYQKREAGADLFIVDADIAIGIERHCEFSSLTYSANAPANCSLAGRVVKAEIMASTISRYI